MINKEDTILVFGGSGKVGKQFIQLLKQGGYTYLAPRKCELNMLNDDALWHYIRNERPDYIVNLAAVTTTIALNKEFPATIHHNTLLMNMNLLNVCALWGNDKFKKIINIISSCAYGESDILVEKNFLKSNVHESVMPHGEAKKQVYLMSQFYKQQYNLPVTCICFNNICGNERWTQPSSLKVLSSLVKKIVDAREDNLPSIEVWGTGVARREFIHVEDAAEGLLQVLNRFDGDLINIGRGIDLSISQIAREIKTWAKYGGQINYDKSKPDGQLSKIFDVSLMHSTFLDWRPQVGWIGLYEKIIAEYEQFLKDNK